MLVFLQKPEAGVGFLSRSTAVSTALPTSWRSRTISQKLAGSNSIGVRTYHLLPVASSREHNSELPHTMGGTESPHFSVSQIALVAGEHLGRRART